MSNVTTGSVGAELALALAQAGIDHDMDGSAESGRVRIWLGPDAAHRLAEALAPRELPEAVREVLRRVGGLVKDEGLRCAATVHPLSRYRASPVLAEDGMLAGCDCHTCVLALDARAALGARS